MSIYDKASLVLIPSGTKTSKVYSQKPTNGDGDFTFSRSTAATRVNASGNIEKETQNLLTYSNDFSNAIWVKNVTATGGQAGYDGSNDAWEISKGTASAYRYVRQSFSATSGVHTASVYAKAGTLNLIALYIEGGSNPYISVNLSTGAITGQRGTEIDTQVTNVGNDWWRISLSFNENSSVFYIYPDWNQSNTGTLYIQDAQLEQGLVARNYIETTTTAIYGGITDNVPRLDYTDSSCPALLLEPQRSNVVTQSEYFGSWNVARATISDNAATSPEGLSNAAVLTEDTTNNSHPVFNSYTTSNGVSYTFSLFAKQGSRRYLQLFASNGGSSVYYDLQNQTAGAGGDIEDYGNGWSRLIYTYTTNSTSATFYIQPSIDGVTQFYTGDGSNATFLYGVQLEAGSYATSYIPTYGSAVTRNADSGQVFNLDTNGILGSSQWTFFAELEVSNNTPSSDKMTLTDADSMPRTYLYNTTLGWAGGWAGSSYNLNLNTNSKVAWRLNDSRNGNIFANGALRATISNQSVDMTADRIILRGQQGTWRLKQILLFPTALTDQELIDLTTI